MYYRELHDDESFDAWRKQLIEQGDKPPTKLLGPPLGINPRSFVEKHFGANSKLPMSQFLHGTTTLAFIYKPKSPKDKGGIVVAADSRATGGQYISSKKVKKILPVTDHMVATMAGGAADCQFWVRILSKFCNLFELREGEPISIAAASKYLANALYNYRGKGLSIGSMVTGIDKFGPALYLVEEGGTRTKLPEYVSVGSGSLNAYSILDLKYGDGKMTDEEALDLGRQAIMHATFRDGGSGGQCNIAHITPDNGVKMFPPIDVTEMYYKFIASKGIKPAHVLEQIHGDKQ